MRRKVLGFVLAASLVVGGIQVPGTVHAEEVHSHTEEAHEEEQVLVAISEAATCNLVSEGTVANPEYKVKKKNGTVLVPDQTGALSYVLNELTEEGDTVILSNANVELTADATVKAGVTLLLPYAEDVADANSDTNGNGAGAVYSTLLVKEGVRLLIKGTVTVAGQTGQVVTAIQNVVTGGHSVIQTEEQSLIDVDSGGTLDVYGYVKGQGNLVARNGAVVSDVYTVLGYTGGGDLIDDLGVGKGESDYPYPFSQSGCTSIDIDAKYYKGATMYGKTKFYLSSRGDHVGEKFLIIGEKGVFRQGSDENSYIERIVTPADIATALDKETIRFAGGGTMSNSSLKFKYIVSVSVTTKYFIYPIGANTTIELTALNGVDNSLLVENAFKFLSGSKLIIGEGTSVTLAEKGFAGTFSAALTGKVSGKESSGYFVFYEGAGLTVNGLLRLEKDGTLAINKDAITIGSNGNISIACDHEQVTTCETREKSGNVTTSIDWSQVETETAHGTETLESDKDGHTGTCEVCGETFEAEEHTYGASVVTPVTCDQDGTELKVCMVCGYEDLVITEKALGHNMEEEWKSQLDQHVKRCTNEGCDHVIMEEHDWEVYEKVEPTYEEPGYVDSKCKVCGEIKQGPLEPLEDDIVPAVEFQFGVTPIKILNDILRFFDVDIPIKIVATDDETGIESIEYLISDVSLTKDELKSREDWSTYEEELKLTDDKEYYVYARVTDNAGNEKIAGSDGLVIDRIASEIEGVVASDVKCGDTTVKVVDDYIDKVYVNGEEVRLSRDNSFVLRPSTEPYIIKAVDHAGNETVIENVVVNSGHTYGEWELTEDTHQKKCIYCEDTMVGKHEYTQYEVLKEVTCDENGVMARYCTICDGKDTKEIDALGHMWMVIEEEENYQKSECIFCGEIQEEGSKKTEEPSASGGGSSSDGPATGDTVKPFMWSMVGVAALAVFEVVRRKRHG